MSNRWSAMRLTQAVLLVGFSVALVGCGHVKRTEMDSELARLRQEVQEGDQMVAERLGGRIGDLESRVESLEIDLRALENDFQMTVERLETALRFNAPVFFAFDDANLRAEDRPLLNRFAEVVKEYYPTALITVEGFTDPSGSRQYNLRLGQERANAVKDYLLAQGLSPDRVRAVSYGEETDRLVAPGQQGPGEQGWENRRVVLVVDHGDASVARGLVAVR